jgi:hypothetical protein
MEITIETITIAGVSAAAGTLLSLLFSYIPGLRTKYAALAEDWKKLVMLGAIIAISGGILALSCTGVIPFIACDKAGLIDFAYIFISTLVANQAVYPITPKTTDVKMLKEAQG